MRDRKQDSQKGRRQDKPGGKAAERREQFELALGLQPDDAGAIKLPILEADELVKGGEEAVKANPELAKSVDQLLGGQPDAYVGHLMKTMVANGMTPAEARQLLSSLKQNGFFSGLDRAKALSVIFVINHISGSPELLEPLLQNVAGGQGKKVATILRQQVDKNATQFA